MICHASREMPSGFFSAGPLVFFAAGALAEPLMPMMSFMSAIANGADLAGFRSGSSRAVSPPTRVWTRPVVAVTTRGIDRRDAVDPDYGLNRVSHGGSNPAHFESK